MGHYAKSYVIVEAPKHFAEFWAHTRACDRDGCNTVHAHTTKYSDMKSTEARTAAFIKEAKKNVKGKYDLLDTPNSYTVEAYDVGITQYQVRQKKNKIVNHKRTEVTICKEYKSKPAHIPAGAWLVEMHQYVISYDGRCYDPLEHGCDCDF